jgi:DNA-binding transcriptional regulator GbsR (MarR family)
MRSNKPFIYNPAQKSRDQFSEEYILRKNLYDRLLQDIADAPKDIAPQHYLRLKYAIEDNPELNQWIIPIQFSEEQYSITRLEHLWEETAALLESQSGQYEGLYNRISAYENADRYDAISFEILEKELKQNGHRILLLIDNVGDLFDKFPDIQNHLLRQILMASPAIQLVGCSSRMLEHTFRYDKPFFEFFHQLKLEPLDRKTAIELLRALGKEYHQEEAIENIIEKTPARIEVLRRLTGGVPRTMVLLFNIFIDNASGTAFDDLQHLLDEVNSLYKHRMDELKPQQQQIIDTLAKTWEPMTAKEVLVQSKLAREDIKSNQISAQLKQLADNQIVESIETKGRTQSYRIRERFFNIWYLMRHGRKKNKEEVLWLVRFLEDWCTKSQLREMAKKHIIGMKNPEYSESGAYYKARALAEVKGIDEELRIEMLEVTASFLVKKGLSDKASEMEDYLIQLLPKLIGSKVMNLVSIENFIELEKLIYSLPTKFKTKRGIELNSIYRVMAASFHLLLKNTSEAKKYYLMAVELKNVDAMFELGMLFEKEGESFDLVEKYYLLAADNNHREALVQLGYLYLMGERSNSEKAGKYLKLGADAGSYRAMNALSAMFFELLDYENAKRHALMSLQIEPDNTVGLLCLFNVCKFDNPREAISCAVKFLNKSEVFRDNLSGPYVINYLFDLAQYQILLGLFKEENSLIMKHAFPYYYALAYFIPDDLPGVYTNVGSELKETVDEIIKSIEVRRDELALNKAV